MDCKRVQKMIPKYISDQLTEYEMMSFLDHINQCHECYDELEITYMTQVGLTRLDEEGASYDLSGAMQQSLKSSANYIAKMTKLKVCRYACSTLAVYGVLIVLILELRLLFFHY